MATEKELEQLLGRALTDEEFRAQLFDDPQQAARDVGYELTAQQLATLKSIDMQTVAENLDQRLLKRSQHAAP